MRGADRGLAFDCILAALIVVAIAVSAVSRVRHTTADSVTVLPRALPTSAPGWSVWVEDEWLEDCESEYDNTPSAKQCTDGWSRLTGAYPTQSACEVARGRWTDVMARHTMNETQCSVSPPVSQNDDHRQSH